MHFDFLQQFLSRDKKRIRQPSTGLGTFLGVYTPTILTILGVIMYLRFGWVLGQVGLIKTLLIVLLANAITLAASLSLSAIATNSRVGVGGAYFIISRGLGAEIGGAIGLPLFLSQALSVTLYAYGLAESFRFLWPELPLQLTAFVVILLVGALSLKGADFALKVQVPMLALIAISLLVMGGGSLFGSNYVGAAEEVAAGVPFWAVFAVFFPAVTGIMAGLSLSGDLADPQRSIPRGTLAAVLTGLAIYLLVPVLLALGSDPATLRSEPLIWAKIAVLGPWLVLPGLWGAIFSSAVGSALGAPRTLQALATDRLVPTVLGRTRGEGGEPVMGLAATMVIALAAVFLGGLNAVATVVSMFFLTVYGVINLVAALEKLSGNPSWRPRIQVPWAISLLGALACFGVMILINPLATLVALAFQLGLWLLLKKRVRNERWGDLRRDLYEAIIRWALFRLAGRPMTARNWRPHPLVFVGDVRRRLDLVQFAAWFGENRGVMTVCELVEGDVMHLDFDIVERSIEMDEVLKEAGIPAFAEVNVVQDIARGVVAVTQANGLGGLEANTVMVGWPDSRQRLVAFLKTVRPLKQLNRSLMIGRLHPLVSIREGHQLEIHIWWGGLQRNGDLQLLLAYLLTCNISWRNARIRVLSLASSELMAERTRHQLRLLIPEIRINAEIDVRIREAGASLHEIMQRESANADLVLLGLACPEEGKEAEYAERLSELTDGLPSCFLIHNGSLFIGELVSPQAEENVVKAEPLSPVEKNGDAAAKVVAKAEPVAAPETEADKE
jgi:potassium/chloride transporter 4/5/6